MKRTLLTLLAAFSLTAIPPVSAAETKTLISRDATSGVAIEGYDPVAFFTDAKPTKGDPKIRATVQGVTYLFANAAHKDAFEKSPAQYLPQFGGYCAFGVALGVLLPVDISTWVIRDGKLYLNYSPAIAELFAKDPAGTLKTAESKWPAIVREQAK